LRNDILFAWGNLLHPAFLLYGEWAVFVDREECLIRLEFRKDFLDGVDFSSVLRIIARENDPRVPPLSMSRA